VKVQDEKKIERAPGTWLGRGPPVDGLWGAGATLGVLRAIKTAREIMNVLSPLRMRPVYG
jgi:hypothetical protein